MADAESGARRAFPRTLDAVSDLLDWTERFFEAAAVPGDHRYGVQLGLEELFTNLVKYGAGSHPIEVELVRRDSLLLASLTDEDVEPFDAERIEVALKELCERLGLKPRQAFQPIRVAVTGSRVSPGLYESIELLGRDESLGRIRRAAAVAA